MSHSNSQKTELHCASPSQQASTSPPRNAALYKRWLGNLPMQTYPTRSITYNLEGNMQNTFTVHSVPWESCAPLLNEIRVAASQMRTISHADALPDGKDELARHAIAVSTKGQFIGCARILPGGHVERIAVLPHEYQAQIKAAMVEILNDFAQQVHWSH